MKASIIADSFDDSEREELFWSEYRKKSQYGFASLKEQIKMTEYADILLKKKSRAISLFNKVLHS